MNTTALFMASALVAGAAHEMMAIPSRPIYRMEGIDPELSDAAAQIERGVFNGDINAVAQRLIAQLNRGITSTMTAFPVRENLEAEAKILIPVETPLRNRLPRTVGSGKASLWKTITAFGTGLGTATTASGAVNAVNTFTVANANGFYAGETILYNGVTSHTIVSVNYTTNVITVGATPGVTVNSQTNGASIVKTSLFHVEGGAATQSFFTETGAPAEKTTVYADRSAAYKILGEMGSVTVFAMASGANFQNQLATEKRNRMYSVMLSEENALLNGSSTSTKAPWGDGVNALAFDGMIPLITANAPANQVQTSVGQLTTAFLDTMLARLHYQGGRKRYMLMNGQEINSLAKLASQSGNHRIMIDRQADATMGVRIAGYVHPISGETVDVLWDPFVPAGTILFGVDYLPDGSPAADVEVLPQTMLPELAPNEQIQGYVAQEIAPAATSPHKLPFLISVFEVLRMKSYTHFGIATGVTPA